jgi:hypothetical protein
VIFACEQSSISSQKLEKALDKSSIKSGNGKSSRFGLPFHIQRREKFD